MINPIQFFTDRFNLTFADIESLLAAALSQGGDYADLYFEHTINGSLTLEEQIVKAANRTVEQGVGVRVISGERSGFAYCDEISVAAIRKAALTAAHIAESGAQVGPVNVTAGQPKYDLYPVEQPTSAEPLERKIELLQRADKTARAHDPRIREAYLGI